ncbi:hypothetical protein TWF281_007686 [Arthrobotrys megalospora]
MRLNPEAWKPYEQRIRSLYLTEKRSVAEVKRIIEGETNFTASIAQYHHQIQNVLKLRKNLSKEDIEYYNKRKRKRDEEGKETRVKLCGVLLDEMNLRRKCQRKHFTVLEQFEKENANETPLTPPGLDVGTPTTCSSPGLSDVQSPPFLDAEDGFDIILNYPISTLWKLLDQASDPCFSDTFISRSRQAPSQSLALLTPPVKENLFEDYVYVMDQTALENDIKIFKPFWEADVSQLPEPKHAKLSTVNRTVEAVSHRIVLAKSLRQLLNIDFDYLTLQVERLRIMHVLLSIQFSPNLDEVVKTASNKGYYFLAEFITRYLQDQVPVQSIYEEGSSTTTPDQSPWKELPSTTHHLDEFEAFVNWSPKSYASE